MSWGDPQTSEERALAALLTPVSVGFGVAAYLRMKAYTAGIMRQKRSPVPVISIGNITCGGTGKTPVTIDLSQKLIGSGKRVAILSRGYKRLSQQKTLVVSDGKELLADCQSAGDEPYMMAKNVPGAVVIVGAKRTASARLAVEDYNCDCLLLDDGFQHFSMGRSEDIVLLDYNDNPENDHLLPAGRLREPLSALTRADCIVVTKIPKRPDKERLVQFRALIKRYAPQATLTACRFVPHLLRSVKDKQEIPIKDLNGKKVVAFSGIARPEPFLEDIREAGGKVVWQQAFGDHHWYQADDLQLIKRQYEESGADLIVTTEKDAVRLENAVTDLPLHYISLKTEWLGPHPLTPKGSPNGEPATMEQTAAK